MRGLICFLRWRDFEGTSSRSEYWNFVLIAVALVVISAFLRAGMVDHGESEARILITSAPFLLLWFIIFVVGISATIRRLNDAGFSPKWALLLLVPVANLAVIALLARRTKPKPARRDPKPIEWWKR